MVMGPRTEVEGITSGSSENNNGRDDPNDSETASGGTERPGIDPELGVRENSLSDLSVSHVVFGSQLHSPTDLSDHTGVPDYDHQDVTGGTQDRQDRQAPGRSCSEEFRPEDSSGNLCGLGDLGPCHCSVSSISSTSTSWH